MGITLYLLVTLLLNQYFNIFVTYSKFIFQICLYNILPVTLFILDLIIEVYYMNIYDVNEVIIYNNYNLN